MEQEPVYVASGKLTGVCESVLAKIYETRQQARESYVMDRVHAYNQAAHKSNKWRGKLTWLGITPRDYITPYGMELQIKDEIQGLDRDAQLQHPMVVIHQQYGNLEHETKDCLIQCAMNDSVAIGADMARGISHLGLSLDFMQRRRIGF